LRCIKKKEKRETVGIVECPSLITEFGWEAETGKSLEVSLGYKGD
jgi:hypothetical protein